MFICVRWVHSGALRGSSGSPGLLRTFGRTLGVIGFILVRWVHSGARPEVRWVLPRGPLLSTVSLGSFRLTLGVVGLILGRLVNLRAV